MGNKTPPKEHQFSSTNQPKNSGRKPNKLKKFIDDNGLTSSDISATIKYILPLTEEEIKKLGGDERAPIMMRMFVAAVFSREEYRSLAEIANITLPTFIDLQIGHAAWVLLEDMTTASIVINRTGITG